MELLKLCYFWIVISFLVFQFVLEGSGQEAGFELPVQLVGFPFIIMAVRLTNFVKKLAYALNPATYRSRNRRQLAYADTDPFDAVEVEKYIVGEFGARACVFERVCAHYAARAQRDPKPQMDWPDVFSHYKRSSDQAKDFYLLSVFLGDIVGSPAAVPPAREAEELRRRPAGRFLDTFEEMAIGLLITLRYSYHGW